jgi:hypothetical protein
MGNMASEEQAGTENLIAVKCVSRFNDLYIESPSNVRCIGPSPSPLTGNSIARYDH